MTAKLSEGDAIAMRGEVTGVNDNGTGRLSSLSPR
jgi:hypothetical protein